MSILFPFVSWDGTNVCDRDFYARVGSFMAQVLSFGVMGVNDARYSHTIKQNQAY